MTIETITIILAGLAILTYIISFIKGLFKIKTGVDNPNIKQNLELALIQTDLRDLRENHINHIEKDIKELVKGQAKIQGILLNK